MDAEHDRRRKSQRLAQESLLLSDLPDPRDEQLRMRRLQVCNWGTFAGLHEVPIAERGFLIVGRSGSGKSTLLDAMSALLVPPNLVDFNAAAREAERSGRDRSLVSYVRGAWADQQDEGSGEIATQYLRRGTTWSALALEYRNAQGRVVSLVRLFWIKGAGSAADEVKKHYMVAERTFDVAVELDGFDLDLRKLKARLGDGVAHFDAFSGYAERFRRLLGIGSEMALKLLHKTQSAKNLGDLNQFLRGFMLDEPETFKAADSLVADFADLDAAHQAVVTAREQVRTLAPAREADEALTSLRRKTSELNEVMLGIDTFRERCRQELLLARRDQIDIEAQAVAGELAQREQFIDNLGKRLLGLEQQRRERGGDAIDRLEQERGAVERERDTRLKHRARAEAACKALGRGLPGTAQAFAEAAGEARQLLDCAEAQADDIEARMDELKRAGEAGQRRFGEVRGEIEVLRLNPSNIPAHMQDLRTRLCGALKLPPNAFPFVGELIEVKSEHADWRGAIERLLHGFALALLVDERHHGEVAAWVNKTHLGGKLVYYRVGRAEGMHARVQDSRSLPHRLNLQPHAFRGWLNGELARRFDYACVDNLVQFRSADFPRALTREGQVKHAGERYEKDDRHEVGNRKHWVLGFDNRDKLALFEEEARALAQTIADNTKAVDDLRAQRTQEAGQRLHANTLANLAWEEIDLAPTLQRLGEIAAELLRLREGDADLRSVMTDIEALRDQEKKAEAERNQQAATQLKLQGERREVQARIESSARTVADVGLTPAQEQGLRARVSSAPSLSLGNLDERFRTIERGLQDALKEHANEDNRLVDAIVECFRAYKRKWPQDAGDFTPDMHSREEYLARLQRLELDGLPKHEARFFELLQNQSKQDLLVLDKHMREARKSIGQRLDEVNLSLERVPFNHDAGHATRLQIKPEDRNLPEVAEFRERLKQVLTQHLTEDRALAEAKFSILRGLVERLAAKDTAEQRRWREQVLDVRLHVEFAGIESDAQTGRQIEVYRSGAGKSGGQRQKLATTCLAAALRYQLGGEDGYLPRYAPVVLDEAFDKADNEFTALAMGVFENFGFQMVVATPLKSVMTLEPFIGGACFVDIRDRNASSVLLIEYDEAGKRLALPEQAPDAGDA
ncbi:MAG: ATP-binding protein [Proteobacteria bacterium]|nr:ATP-binding protein [Pseudomonadota bacterium]